ncbi:MAG: electron transfer flavoprotein subunit beta/FixA family protein [Candidatus Aureabacteria bacterium]|nr:electron transfer flavoprotein subunit beta/FixA family protein [Candidatus Auribacterota bacterium]MCK5160961.1 electron transfer flavoprotein subunit beta/FixA family protein [Candidatus Auribacterota bacterium]
MDIVICIKQVPDTTDIRIDPETNTLVREGVASIINPFDMYAIEEGVRIKEKYGGKVTVISMGPPQVEAALREAISLGVDEAVLLSDRAFAGSDTLATSFALSEGLKKIGYDIIICGKQAIDGDTAQVGPGIATHLDIPQITYVKKIEKIENGKIVSERMVEEGYEVVESTLPVLLTVVKEINEPRLPSLKGKMKAKKSEIKIITTEDLKIDTGKVGLDGSPTWVMKIFTPPKKEGGKIFKGTADEVVAELMNEIQNGFV